MDRRDFLRSSMLAPMVFTRRNRATRVNVTSVGSTPVPITITGPILLPFAGSAFFTASRPFRASTPFEFDCELEKESVVVTAAEKHEVTVSVMSGGPNKTHVVGHGRRIEVKKNRS